MSDRFDVKTVVDGAKHNVILGEGALWNYLTQELVWIDILGKRLFFYNPSLPDDKKLRWITVSHYVGTAIPKKDGGVVLAMQNGFTELTAQQVSTASNQRGETMVVPRPLADPEAHLPGNRFNDGKVGPDGRFYAGTMALKEEKDAGWVYSLDKDFKVHKIYGPVTISNGMAWTKDTKTFYYVDTPQLRLDAFDFDAKTSKVSNHRVAVNFPKEYGFPDGITIDNEDNVWVAHWEGSRITRWNPRTGKLLLTIPIPTKRVTSVAFGGPKLNDIYITSASVGLDRSQHPAAGSLFVIYNTPFTGVKADLFQENGKQKL